MLFFGIVLTVCVFYACKWLYKRFPIVMLTPLITCLAITVALLLAAHVSYPVYMQSGKWLTEMLNPATVALAIPLYKNAHIIKTHAFEFLTSLIFGASVAIVSSVLFARWFKLSHFVWTSVEPRSVTTPIAMDISQSIGGIPTLTAVFVIITALAGILVGPMMIRRLGIRSEVGRGTLLGMGAHGIGTSKAFEFGELEGTFASLSMIVAAGLTLVLTPVLMPFLQR